MGSKFLVQAKKKVKEKNLHSKRLECSRAWYLEVYQYWTIVLSMSNVVFFGH